jgi:hypothetical protein
MGGLSQEMEEEQEQEQEQEWAKSLYDERAGLDPSV